LKYILCRRNVPDVFVFMNYSTVVRYYELRAVNRQY
jgi:hypothetical protein